MVTRSGWGKKETLNLRSSAVGGRAKKFSRDGSARPGPVGLEMLCYMLSHEDHHRGQVSMLAHQLGFRCGLRWRPGSGNWESCGKSVGRLVARATILKESLRGTTLQKQ
jgi:DinB family protein